MKVLFVAAEATPYCKTGGLADVAGSLPQALARQEVDTRLILPRYKSVELQGAAVEEIAALRITFDGALREVSLQRVQPPTNSIPQPVTYLLDAPEYFDRAQLYGYEDDILRFGFFSRAVLEALPHLEDWRPDVVHCHDWHTALLPAYKSTLATDNLPNFKIAFTIHNLVYQGLAAKEYLPRLGFDWPLFNYHQLEFYGQINALKSGLIFSDAITTVSPTYAREIQTSEQGAGLEGVLAEHAHQLSGIINGIDYNEWNPATDPYLAAPFEATHLEGKKVCKRDLQQLVGLPVDESIPLIGIVSRLSSQKGFDLIASGLSSLLAMNCQLVVLGAGDDYYMKLFEKLAKQSAGRAAFKLGVRDEPLAHKIYAGSDLFLMPSQYEPCGLSQMIALAYGTIPIVRATGGLADTTVSFDSSNGTGNGFVFQQYNSAAMLTAVREALTCYHSQSWPQALRNAFASDFSWDASAQKYAELYESLVSADSLKK